MTNNQLSYEISLCLSRFINVQNVLRLKPPDVHSCTVSPASQHESVIVLCPGAPEYGKIGKIARAAHVGTRRDHRHLLVVGGCERPRVHDPVIKKPVYLV